MAWERGREDMGRKMLPWIAVGIFAIANAVLGAGGRGGYVFLGQPLETRYTTIAIYLPVALVNLIPMICGDLKLRLSEGASYIWKQAPAVAGAGLIMLQLNCVSPALAASDDWRNFQREAKAAVLLIDVLPHNPELVNVFPTPVALHRMADAASACGYMHPRVVKSADADLIQANNLRDVGGAEGRMERYVIGKDAVQLFGWAIFRRFGEPADAVFLTYEDGEGRHVICKLADMGLQRDDIAREMGQRNYEKCGWQATLRLAVLPSSVNTTRINAWAFDTDTGKAVPLEGSIVIQR